jgi:peptidoglycan/LPS O-acetylase OafA/YrhL
VAVLLVAFDHAGIPGFTGGYVGVDVFFVISGFLITGILAREAQETGRLSIAGFYARRARRILPAATVTLLAVVAASGLIFTVVRLRTVLTHATWAALFAANIYSARAGTDYFARQDTFVSPVLHFWSLAVEEQFYLVWPPLAALVVWAGARRHGFGPALRRRLRLVVVVLGGASLAWSIWETAAAPTPAYYSTLTRGWELAAGALLALCTDAVARWAPPARAAASWVGLGLIGAAALHYGTGTAFPGYHAMVPVVGAVLVLAGGVDPPRHGAGLVLDTPPMRWFGDISYSLYLWHWPILVLPVLYLAQPLTGMQRLALLALATAVAWLSYRYVERPLLRAQPLNRTPLASLALWPAAVSLVLGAVSVTGLVAIPPHPNMTAVDFAAPMLPGYSPVAAVRLAAAQARAGRPLPTELYPDLEDLAADIPAWPGCELDRDAIAVPHCVGGDRSARHTIAVFGDSHTIMWMRPVTELAAAAGWRVVPFEKANCFPVDATEWRGDESRPYTECDAWRTEVIAQIAALHPDRIIMSGRAPQTFVDPATGRPASDQAALGIFDTGERSMLATLRAITPHVYAIGATPNLPRSVADCLGTTRATMATCAQGIPAVTTQINTVWRRDAQATGATFVDPVPWLCADGLCPLVIGGVIVYWDDNHITPTFAETLRPVLASSLDL